MQQNIVIITKGMLLLKPERKTAHATIAVFLTHHGSLVAVCCLYSVTLSSFSTLMLLVG